MSIEDLYGFECVPVNNDIDIDDLFEKMREDGKENGYTPIIIIDEKVGLLRENIDMINKEYGSLENYRKYCLEKCNEIDVNEFFHSRKCEIPELLTELMGSEDTFYDYKNFSPITNIDIFQENNKVYIAKVPTIKPYEVFAYIPIGGFNDCPSDEEHIAVAKYWYEKYGAFPIAIGSDTVQYSAKNPIEDNKKFDDLCIELVLYCEDIIVQGYETLKVLKEVLQRSTIWLFWWD
ncbi:MULTISPECIES: DUF4253 domain-containing protein [Clostridioides]|uniref:DUF4253 domain-containing protein n=1 Tax=Clostridioides sp. ZZV14-6387 TaxID=2811497 RepID=UPI0007BB86E4|nr:DUF4253 domain-containing protein [Clostridioides sp. ZZV14-6387]MDI7815926.1 DUF4253 domain-containing protein [Clostridioides difficile]NJI82508.1 DUF4253 domain-containing protein [Clostridioides difficile]CZR97166.1 hypothetical protein CDFC105_61959 [Clostridioides difficile]CZS08543.1 hypothetical protein CDFC105_72827 [Clostridioides difficile]